MIKALIFDAYGTLISTGTGSVDAAGEILKKRGRKDISAKDFYADWKKYHRAHIDGLTEFITEEEVFRMDLRRLYEDYEIEGDADADVMIMLETLGKRKAFPEAGEVISRLSQKYVLCIGSTSDTKPLMTDIKNNRIDIKRVYTSEALMLYKPKREFYTAIADDLGIQSDQILFVGDSLTDDVFGPSRIGMKTCYVDRRSTGCKGFLPDCAVKTLDGLLELL